MRLIFSILTAIVVIAAAIIFVGPLFISADDVRNQIFAQVESTTGYRIRVSGPVAITLFPSLDLVAEDVGIAQPATGSDAEFATAKTLKFGLMLRGLLDGKMRVTDLTLVEPNIALPASSARPASAEQSAGQPGDMGGGGSGGGTTTVVDKLRNLTLDKLVIENGTVTLPPSGGAPGKRLEKLYLEASLPAYDKPLSFDVAAHVDRKPIRAKGSVSNFGQFLEGAPARVDLSVDAPETLDAPAAMSGTATYKDDIITLSQFSAKSGDKTLSGSAVYQDGTVSLSSFTATSGRDTFAGKAVYKDNVVNVSPFRANVRGTLLSGSVTANLTNKIFYVEAALAAKTLDVNQLTDMPRSKPSRGGGGSGGGGGGGSSNGGGGGRSASPPWSDEKIDFAPLRLVNGKFSVSAEQLIYDHVKISPVTIHATLNGGKLNATLSNFNLYDGGGNVAVAVDASGKTPSQRVKLSLAKFNARALLIDAANFERIEGRGTVSLDLSAYGASQRAMVSTLGGNANLEFVDGAIHGINIAQMLRNLGTGIVEGWQGGDREKTDFASLGASFSIDKGKARTKDLHLVGPLVRMSGTGTVNLPDKTLSFRVDPQLVASLEGQGGQRDLAGLGVPVMIVGPWAKPKVYPDIKGILENPVAAYERFRQFGDGVAKLPGLDKIDKSGALQSVIKDGKVDKDALIEGIGGLLGGSQQQAAPAPQGADEPVAAPPPEAKKAKKKSKKDRQKEAAEDAARQLLDSFLGD